MNREPERVWPTSAGIRRIPLLSEMLDAQVLPARLRGLGSPSAKTTVIAGWGARPSGRRAEQQAKRLGLPCWRLEDGFLRSFGLGDQFPPLSVTVDPVGIYYDSTRPSLLENLLNERGDLLAGIADDVQRARSLIVAHRLSKYNHAPNAKATLHGYRPITILVVDQTVGDMSIALSGATAQTFTSMLAAAKTANPAARIIVKTHPEAIAGRKAGHLTGLGEDPRVLVLRDDVNPLSLLEQVDQVYTVSSHLGFEGLLAGKEVHCFGMPWYAGWGLTHDRGFCERRRRRRSIDDLFAAAYFHLSRYINPATHRQGTIFDVIDFLIRQKTMAASEPPKTWCVGFRRWKAVNTRPLIGLHQKRIEFVDSFATLRKRHVGPKDRVVRWGVADPPAVDTEERAYPFSCRMEDGFIRSIGLGSDLIRPVSLVLDSRGIYFDPSQPSALEVMLCEGKFRPRELAQAAHVRRLLVNCQLTKYNTDVLKEPDWSAAGDRLRILVPGQVADDASIRLGSASTPDNLALLRSVRRYHPDAFIVYRPHPDVMSRNRKGALAAAEVMKWADHIETEAGILGCIAVSDCVHTISSLTGFDALLRDKPVITYGQPFYAGWGLTEDRAPVARRGRKLDLNELIAATLLRYPVYWDWTLNGYTSCEAAINHLIDSRETLRGEGNGELPRTNYWQRQSRKLKILGRAWTAD